MTGGYYYVCRRYTTGDEGIVDGDTARRVAEQERAAHALLNGSATMGLRGIVEHRLERRVGKETRLEIRDLCTGERLDMPRPEVLRKTGYHLYSDLGARAQAVIDANPPAGMGDHRRCWYRKVEAGWYGEPPIYEPFVPGVLD